MATALIDTAALAAEFPTLEQSVIDRVADEVVGEASLYAPQILATGYEAPLGIQSILTRAARGQIIALVEQGKGPMAASLTAGGLAIKLDKDGSNLYGSVFTQAQIDALRASMGSPQASVGSMTVW